LLARLPEGALELRHARTGKTLAESIAAAGGDPGAAEICSPRDPAAIGAYLEVHIEQAPQLIEADAPIAVCLANPAICAIPSCASRVRMRILACHIAFGVMPRWQARICRYALELWLAEEAAGRPMAVTIGRFHTPADRHSLTAVSGDFELSLDLRAYDAAHLVALNPSCRRLWRMSPRAGVSRSRLANAAVLPLG
jgi:N-carbamoyl-L-amino-acid hydrolase